MVFHDAQINLAERAAFVYKVHVAVLVEPDIKALMINDCWGAKSHLHAEIEPIRLGARCIGTCSGVLDMRCLP